MATQHKNKKINVVEELIIKDISFAFLSVLIGFLIPFLFWFWIMASLSDVFLAQI